MDVLSLLASSGKTGELRVSGRVDGQLWLEEGKFIASRIGSQSDHVEVVFQLLRSARGTFVFEDGSSPPALGEVSPVDAVVRQATDRLAEWRVIETAIPSMDYRTQLRSELPHDEVTLRADQWRVVTAIGGDLSVRQMLEKLGLGEFEGCRLVKELIDGGLMTVAAPPARLTSVAPEPPRLPRRRPIGSAEPVVSAAPVDLNGRAAVAPPPGVSSQPMGARTRPAAVAEPAIAAASVNGSAERALVRPVDPARARRRRVLAGHDEIETSRTEPRAESRADSRGERAPAAVTPRPAVPKASPQPAENADPSREDGTPADEPINRGLLLKFLSSVRS